MDNPYFYSMDSLASIQFKPMLLFNSNVRFYSIEAEDPYGDHIVPWSKGGKTVPENLQMLCRRCNGMKSDH